MTAAIPRVALLRGVNVGGVRVRMADLVAAAEDLGWQNARTYIASGQMVFTASGESDALAEELMAALEGRIGRRIPILVLDDTAFRSALADCPFDPAEGRHVHVIFLWQAPKVDRDLYEDLRAEDETLVLDGGRAWLHAPSGIGRSKLVEKLDGVIRGTTMTARNLNTVRKLAEMLDEAGGSG